MKKKKKKGKGKGKGKSNGSGQCPDICEVIKRPNQITLMYNPDGVTSEPQKGKATCTEGKEDYPSNTTIRVTGKKGNAIKVFDMSDAEFDTFPVSNGTMFSIREDSFDSETRFLFADETEGIPNPCSMHTSVSLSSMSWI